MSDDYVISAGIFAEGVTFLSVAHPSLAGRLKEDVTRCSDCEHYGNDEPDEPQQDESHD